MAPVTNVVHHRQERKIPVSARKPVKKKAKDKPKRPLSAYNFFFKEERAKIVAVVLNEEGRDKDPELTDEEIVKLRKDSGKVNFEELGKLIGRRWKDISKEREEVCIKLAESDKERYRIEMEKYKVKKEEMREKRRDEAQYAQMAAAPGQHHHPPMMSPSMMRYSEMQPSYGTDAPMGYAPPFPYPMDNYNAAHYGYHHPHHPPMNMTSGAYNPYYMSSMPPANFEGRLSPMTGASRAHSKDPMNNSHHQYQNDMSQSSEYQHPPEYYRSDTSNTNGHNDQSYHPQQHGQQKSLPSSSSENVEPDLDTLSTYHSQQKQQQSYNSSNNHVNIY